MKFHFKRVIVIVFDLFTIPAAWLGAYWIRQNFSDIPLYLMTHVVRDLPFVILLQGMAFSFFGLYRGQWRFASIPDLVRIVKAALVGAMLILVAIYFVSAIIDQGLVMPPRSIVPLYALLLVFLLGGARLAFRIVRELHQPKGFKEKVMIVGAGYAGESLIRELLKDHLKRYYPALLIDDDSRKKGIEILGVRVMGKTEDIPHLAKDYGISQILIAIPSAGKEAMQAIVEACQKAVVPYRTLPGLSDFATGKISMTDLREVSLEDLLGREPIDLHAPNLQHYFEGKKILVTGGGGSIGSELCRQLASFSPKALIIFEHSEYNLYEIERQLKEQFPLVPILSHLQDITDKEGVERLFKLYHPEIVFHAAAYKHVPLLQDQLLVAVKNNILGTKILAELSHQYEVKKFILISTDKAVNPTNIMGTTKRIAEIFCQNLNAQSTTAFMTVRFGNVLGSAGSVVPLFQKQLKAGGPLTVTHPDITRYFMTIPEASQLILQASILGEGSEIFVLDMGEPIKITFLAEQIIRLSGKEPGADIEIRYTGLRPGEKLYEELFHDKESLVQTANPKIFKAQSRTLSWDIIQEKMQCIEQGCVNYSFDEVKKILKFLVPESEIK